MSEITFYTISREDRTALCQNVEAITGIPAYAVEKDWWVTETLRIIFGMEVAKQLVFKGGTSLSKAWKLIERFSEDIDLAIDRSFFGYAGDLSKGQRTRLRKETSTYITNVFYPELAKKFKEKGYMDVRLDIIPPQSSDQDPRIIEIQYPFTIKSPGYILPKVQVEIGCRSLREPFQEMDLSAFVDEQFPDIEIARLPVKIPSVTAERTFLEKLFLLHEEFQRPKEKIRVDRLSRHLYDIYQLSRTKHAVNAIADKKLYETIVNHRHIFTKVGGVNYNLHNPQQIRPVPIAELEGAWKSDYAKMQEQMIYGESPSYEDMITGIRDFLKKLNGLEWKMETEFPIP